MCKLPKICHFSICRSWVHSYGLYHVFSGFSLPSLFLFPSLSWSHLSFVFLHLPLPSAVQAWQSLGHTAVQLVHKSLQRKRRLGIFEEVHFVALQRCTEKKKKKKVRSLSSFWGYCAPKKERYFENEQWFGWISSQELGRRKTTGLAPGSLGERNLNRPFRIGQI